MSPSIGFFASSMLKVNPAMTLIGTVTAVGGETTLTFSSIPQTYTDLQIWGVCRDTNTGAAGATSITMRLNADSGANYAYHYLYGNGSTATASGATAGTLYLSQFSVTDNTAANVYSASVMDISDYTASSKNKTLRWISGQDANVASVAYYAQLNSALWLSTAAITNIAFYAQTAFKAGSSFQLYGQRAAA